MQNIYISSFLKQQRELTLLVRYCFLLALLHLRFLFDQSSGRVCTRNILNDNLIIGTNYCRQWLLHYFDFYYEYISVSICLILR